MDRAKVGVAVAQGAPRALGLIRVSKERDGMISPEVQRVAITEYCDSRGYELVTTLEGIDQSGSRSRSAWWPTLDRAVAAAEAGEFDVLVVWKFSRTARHRLRWAVALDRVESAGGRLESATEQFDTTTSSGRLARGMLAELNAFEAERIGDGWREAHRSRVSSGRPANGKPRWGYRYDTEQKVHVPDPETGPVLADLYRRYVAGESVYALVRWLNQHGFRTLDGYGPGSGGSWSDRSLRRVMDSGFASGQFIVDGKLHAGVHEPLIDAELWEAYLVARGSRRQRPARSERSQYLLSGLVRCGRCGGSMVAGQFGHAGQPKYRCATSKAKGPEACSGGYVMAAFVEQAVLAWLEQHPDALDAAVAAHVARAPRRLRLDPARFAAQIETTEAAMTRLALQDARHPLPAAVYAEAQRELADRLRDLEAGLEAAWAGSGDESAPDTGFRTSDELLTQWHAVPLEYRREILRATIRPVRVLTGRPSAVITIERLRGGDRTEVRREYGT